MDAIQIGDIVLEHSYSPLAKLIQWFQGYFNHVKWIYYEVFTIEALGQGVVPTLNRKMDLKNKRRFRVVRIKEEFLSHDKVVAAVEFAAKVDVGKRYGFMQIPMLAWAIITRQRRKLQTDVDKGHGIICIELVARTLHDLYGFTFTDKVRWENQVPMDIANSEKVRTLDLG